jgi:hypothetical protein
MFSRLPTTRKGAIAEQFVRDVLTTMGWHIYAYAAERPHPVDMLAITADGQLVGVEVKCKCARIYYPDTGIDRADYYAYHQFQSQLNLPVLLLFVDTYSKTVYGNYLDYLSQPLTIVDNGRELQYPMITERYVYFPLQAMEHYADIPPKTVALLNIYTSSKYHCTEHNDTDDAGV